MSAMAAAWSTKANEQEIERALTMHIPDPIEAGEARAERWADENVKGDNFLCAGCDEWYPIDSGVTATPDPYAPLICTKCAEHN